MDENLFTKIIADILTVYIFTLNTIRTRTIPIFICIF